MKKDIDILSKVLQVDAPDNLYNKIQLKINNTSLYVASNSYKTAFSIAAMLILAFNISIVYQYFQLQNNEQTPIQTQILSSDYSSVQNDIYND